MGKKDVKAEIPDAFKKLKALECNDEAFRELHPRLASLFFPRYQDMLMSWAGGRISIVHSGQLVKATLTLDQIEQQITAGSDSMLTLYDALEAALSVPEPVFEPSWTSKRTRLAKLKADM